ncbi:MAG: DUF4386 domain-containing protein [Thermoanaerobaculia bacterium]
MATENRAGRIIGVLIILQMVGGGLVNSVLEAPLFGVPGFLVNAAPHSQQLALAVLIALVAEGLWVGIAVTAFSILWHRSRTMALWLVVLAGVTLAVAVIENVGVMSMVSVSQAYMKASAAAREQIETVRVVVASARNWAHYMGRISDGVTIFVFYLALFRFALIPRVLAGFGLIAVILMLTSVGMPLFGHDVVFPMLAPIGLSQLIVAVWLLTKGFRIDATNLRSA